MVALKSKTDGTVATWRTPYSVLQVRDIGIAILRGYNISVLDLWFMYKPVVHFFADDRHPTMSLALDAANELMHMLPLKR